MTFTSLASSSRGNAYVVEEPLGFLVEDGRTKERLLWAVDTANLGVTADRLTYIAVECNYEESLLNRSDRIPSVLT